MTKSTSKPAAIPSVTGDTAPEIPTEIGRSDRDPFITQCPAWCVDADAHTVQCSPDDRQHYSEYVRVPLELEPMTVTPGDLVHEPVRLQAYLQQNYREAEPRLWLGRDETRGVYLTLGEATRLLGGLQQLLAGVEVAR